MHDINIEKLREQLVNSPTNLEILNFMYETLKENNFPDTLTITLSTHYSSHLKKKTSNLLGYTVKGSKITDTFTIRKNCKH